MLPILTLQIDDLQGGFATLNGPETNGQPLGIDLTGLDGEASTSFAALLPTLDAELLPVEGGAILPLGGNVLPDAESSVPIDRVEPDQELLLAEINNPTPLETRLFANPQGTADPASREVNLAALAASPLRPVSINDAPRAAVKRDSYDLLTGRDMAVRHEVAGTDNPLEVKPAVERGMRVPTLWEKAGEWTAMRESALPTSGSSPLTAGDNGSAIPSTLKALQTSLQMPTQPQTVIAPAAPAAAPLTSSAPPVQGFTIAVPVQESGWSEALSQRVTLLAGGQQTTAEIRLTPAELGPIRVSVAMEDGAANVTFSAQHSVTREAIETALPRLRELLTENGLSLGQASVSDQSTRQGQESERTEHEGILGMSELPEDDEQTPAQTVRTTLGLVDTFA